MEVNYYVVVVCFFKDIVADYNIMSDVKKLFMLVYLVFGVVVVWINYHLNHLKQLAMRRIKCLRLITNVMCLRVFMVQEIN